VISINGERLDMAGRDLNSLIQRNHSSGDDIKVLISRDGLIRELVLKLKKDSNSSFSIQRSLDATAEQTRLGDIWLSAGQ